MKTYLLSVLHQHNS